VTDNVSDLVTAFRRASAGVRRLHLRHEENLYRMPPVTQLAYERNYTKMRQAEMGLRRLRYANLASIVRIEHELTIVTGLAGRPTEQLLARLSTVRSAILWQIEIDAGRP
jgi:hypothetical protein